MMNKRLVTSALIAACIFVIGEVRGQQAYRPADNLVQLVGWGGGCGTCDRCGGARRSSCDCCDAAARAGEDGMLEEAVPPGQEDVLGPGLVAGSFGATAGSLGANPGMIGDFFGGGYQMFLPNITGKSQFTNVPIAGADRRFKIADNNSPFPIDRIVFNYHHFNNAIRNIDGTISSLDRYTLAVEKTFFDGWWSVEGRVPFSDGLRGGQYVGLGDENFDTEFGNISLVVKHLLYDGDVWRFSAGLGIVFPTGAQAEVYSDDMLAMAIDNEAVYLQPFLGASYTPTDRLFVQMFAQADFDAGGNPVTFVVPSGVTNGVIPVQAGVIQDQSLLFLDVAMGYWLYRAYRPESWVTGIAPMVELHYTTTMQDTDVVSFQRNIIANPNNRQDILNLTGGLRFQLRGLSYLTVAGVAPLRNEQIFDSEVSVQYVRTY